MTFKYVSAVALAINRYYASNRLAVFTSNHNELLQEATRNSSLLKSLRFSSSNIVTVDYNFIKGLPKHPKILLIDVREPDELKQTGQIPNSINIPLANVKEELAANVSDKIFKEKYGREKPDLNAEIIFHCLRGKRSQSAAEIATAIGYKNVKNYEGSWLDWAEREGLPK